MEFLWNLVEGPRRERRERRIMGVILLALAAGPLGAAFMLGDKNPSLAIGPAIFGLILFAAGAASLIFSID